jgi:hypothetical protein
MKKIVIVLTILLALSASTFADHPAKRMGIGIVGGSGYGSGTTGGDIGLALKLESMPIYWQLNVHLVNGYFGLGATGDVYFNDENLLKEGDFKLDWFLGLGGYANLGFGSSASAAVGARVPVGLSWHITREFELWLDVVPSLGISVVPLEFPDWNVGGELGFRVWLK